jgi:hypothetical protein
MTGIIPVIACVIRLWTITLVTGSVDSGYSLPINNICSMVEVCLAICISTLPSLAPLLRRIVRNPFNSASSPSQPPVSGSTQSLHHTSQTTDSHRNRAHYEDLELQHGKVLKQGHNTSIYAFEKDHERASSELSDSTVSRLPIQQTTSFSVNHSSL